VLSAIPPGKVFCNGTLWTGELAPLLDATLSAVESMYTAPGLSLGHALNAEGVQTLQLLGRTWLDNVVSQIKRASADGGLDPETGTSRVLPGVRSAGDPSRAQAARASGDAPQPGDPDVTTILRDIELLRTQMGTTAMNFSGVQDAIRRLRRSLDSTRTSDARRPIGQWTKGLSGDAINQRNREFWTQRTTSDAAMSTAARDALASFHKATTPSQRNEAMNAMHKAFWSRDNRPATLPAPESAAHPWAAQGEEMNRRAREFWATRT
jgi:hypothetical protein